MGKSNKSTIISKNIEINTILSDIGNFYRIENLNFICYGITQEEPKRLFPSNKKQYDFINLENLHKTYEFILKKPELNLKTIFVLYELLVNNTHIINTYGLRFRNTNCFLPQDSQHLFWAPTPEKIYDRINEIIYAANDTHVDALTRAFNLHYEIIVLQPFFDYNKRLARFLMNLLLLQNNYTPIIMNKKNDHNEYITAIFNRLNNKPWEYTKYMERSMIHTQNQILKHLKSK